MGMQGPSWGGRVALAAAVGLLPAGLMAVPAYVSSTATAALDAEIGASCVTDLGIVVDSHGVSAESTAARAKALDDVASPVVERRAYRVVTGMPGQQGVGSSRPVLLLWRPGVEELLGVEPGLLTDGSVLAPEWSTADGAFSTGSTVSVGVQDGTGGEPTDVTQLAVAGAYPDIPTRPEPPEWCSYREWFRPNSFGDRPPPVLMTTSATIGQQRTLTWVESSRVYPDPDGLRIDQAEAVLEELTAWQDEIWELEGRRANRKPPILLETSIARARQVADFVRLTTEPLRYASVVAAMVLVVAASLLAARAQRAELRLRVVRGVGVVRLASEQWRWLVPVTVMGGLAGGLSGWMAVRLLGPSPLIEPSALVAGGVAATVGWLVVTMVAAMVIAAAGVATVDRRRRPRRVRSAVVVVAGLWVMAVWSFVRLDEFGGVRQIGVEVRGGDLLAQAFPLLGVLAAIALLAAPMVWLVGGGRRYGGRLSPAWLIGFRRVTFEPVITTTVMMATALAVAIAFQASSSTRSVDRLLADKASAYVGTDLAIRAIDPVEDLTGLGAASTLVYDTTTDNRAVSVLGIDPDSFVDTAWFRSDGLPIPIADAVDALAAEPETAVVVIDPDHELDDSESTSSRTLTVTLDGVEHDLDVITRGDFFPGYQRGRPMLVVDASLLNGSGARKVWVRDPVGDAVDRVTERGVRVWSSVTPQEVFATTNYLSAKWAYATLTAFAIVVAVVTLMGQVLVMESRRRQRRTSRVMTAPMGLRRRDETIASAVETGLPLASGGLIGAAIGWCTSRVAITRLDSLRDRQPPAQLVVDADTLLVAAGVLIVVTVALAWWSSWRSERGDAMEAMRVAED